MDNMNNNTENNTENVNPVEEVTTENPPIEAEGTFVLPDNRDLRVRGNVVVVNTTAVKAGLAGFTAGVLAVPAIKKLVTTIKGIHERRKLRKQIAENMELQKQAETIAKQSAKKKSSNQDNTAAE